MQPATAPTITIPRRALDFPRSYSHYNRPTRNVMAGRRSFRQVTPFQPRSRIPCKLYFFLLIYLFGLMPSTVDSSFSPPSPSELLRGDKSKGKAATRSPSRFMSLSSPTSSQASNLMGHDNAAAGSSSRASGPESPLQFCDSCFAAYPVPDFPNHICTAN